MDQSKLNNRDVLGRAELDPGLEGCTLGGVEKMSYVKSSTPGINKGFHTSLAIVSWEIDWQLNGRVLETFWE